MSRAFVCLLPFMNQYTEPQSFLHGYCQAAAIFPQTISSPARESQVASASACRTTAQPPCGTPLSSFQFISLPEFGGSTGRPIILDVV